MVIRVLRYVTICAAVVVGVCLAADQSSLSAAARPRYEHFIVGNPAAAVTTTTAGGFVLKGGGTDIDAAFEWMSARAGGGDLVVIRASGTDARIAASDPFVVSRVRNAEALFIAGGDQSNYVDFWKGTPLADGIGIDRETALLVIANAGHESPFVYMLRTPGPPEICAPRTPLTFRNIPVYRLTVGSTFNLTTWTGTGGSAYTLSAEAGVLTSSQAGGAVY